MESDLNTILQTSLNFDGFILGGDLNSKSTSWGDTSDNSNGKALKKWLEDNSLDVFRVCDSKPSNPNGASFLDHFLISTQLTDRSKQNFSVSSVPTFSDHFPMKLKLKLESSNIILNPPQSFISYKNSNWDQFRQDLGESSGYIAPPLNCNLENREIDNLIREFNTTFTSIHESHSQKVIIKNGKDPLSERTKKLYKTKYQWQKELKKIFHRTGNRLSSEYKILSKQIQLLKIIIKESVGIEQAEKINNKLQNITPGPSAFKEIYQLTGKRKSPFCNQIRHNDNIISNPSDIANHFQTFYSSVFRDTPPERPVADLESRISNCIDVIPNNIYTFDDSFNVLTNPDEYHFTDPEKIKSVLKNINSKKSCGLDGISNFIIKKFPHATIQLLTCIMNHCINNGYFPIDWKLAKIIPIKK